jgi:oxygen-independent coproporphyrinogen-3 oxidase
MDIESLIAKYDRRVPRYTSYPTAPYFSDVVDGGVYAGWLGALPDDTQLSLYLHVPFCAALCLFCGCNTSVARRAEPLISYANTLIAEIDLVADAIGRRAAVRHIHWGGGTPTALPAELMLAITERLRQRFDVLENAEIAVEVDPRTLSDQSVRGMARMGVNRASLGVQDFDPAVQQAVKRIQSFETTADCAERLRGVGINSINLDLIYGLPMQTTPGVAATVAQAMRILPDRVAVFGYAHVPWMKRHQSLLPEDTLPGPAERFSQRQAAADAIVASGYRAIGLDHFARPDDSLARAAEAERLRRNFQGYTTDDAPALVGLGASSIGGLPQGYMQNATSVPQWRKAVQAGRLPIARGVGLTAEDRLRRDVIERIMCKFAVDLDDVVASHGVTRADLASASAGLDELARDGLVQWDGRRVAVTEAGKPFVRAVAATFDAYHRPESMRHAATV